MSTTANSGKNGGGGGAGSEQNAAQIAADAMPWAEWQTERDSPSCANAIVVVCGRHVVIQAHLVGDRWDTVATDSETGEPLGHSFSSPLADAVRHLEILCRPATPEANR